MKFKNAGGKGPDHDTLGGENQQCHFYFWKRAKAALISPGLYETTWIYDKGGIEPLKFFSANAGQLKRGEDPVGLDLMVGANRFKPSRLVEVGRVGGGHRPDLNTQSNLGDDR
jgi:hypothetical protein